MSEENMLNSESQQGSEATESTEVSQEAVNSESPASTNDAFTLNLDEDIRSVSNLADFKSTNDLAKSYIELQRMVGNSVRIPAEDASDEAKAEFMEKIAGVEGILRKDDPDLMVKLGKPESIEGYDFSETVTADVLDADPGISLELENFKAVAHDIGLTNEQATKLVDMQMQNLTARNEAVDTGREEAEAALKKMWGEDFNNRLAGAKNMVKIYAEKYGDVVSDLVNSPAGNNPALLNMLSELGEMYKERKHEGMSTAQFGLTPELAQAKIMEKRADPGFLKAYYDESHPGHAKANAEMNKLYSIVNGIQDK